MKNYFFWEKGDLFVHFMDIAYEDVSEFINLVYLLRKARMMSLS